MLLAVHVPNPRVLALRINRRAVEAAIKHAMWIPKIKQLEGDFVANKGSPSFIGERSPRLQKFGIAAKREHTAWFWPQDSWRTFQGHIWGTERMFSKVSMSFPKANILSVRGELTLNSLRDHSSREIFVGDPGLLCGHLHCSIGKPRYKLGVWPHWSEIRNPKIQSLVESSSEILLIDPCADIRETIDRAASCEYIAASSLHGLVTADALAIPSCWLRLETGNEDEAGLPLFKYLDYFSAFKCPPALPHVLRADTTLNDLLPKMSSDRHVDVARLQHDLLSVFPYTRTPVLA